MKKLRLLAALFVAGALILAGCGGGGGDSAPQVPNPSPTGSRSGDLDFIFNNQSLGRTTITMKRSEWNKLLAYYDYFYKNENCVHIEKYVYEKGGYKWTVDHQGMGFRLRGNTSRYKPQGKDLKTDSTNHEKANYQWNSGYYDYAKDCDDKVYRQTHFKVDFEEFLEDGEEFKMANAMKGVALKRMDNSCAREIMCYDLFHKYGIWTAPRASHTTLKFNFIEDVDTNGDIIQDITGCETTIVDFGVYEMFEEVNKQFLKARDEDNNKEKQFTNYWKNNKGNLWKIGKGDLTASIDSNAVGEGNLTPASLTGDWKVGVEDVRIETDENGNFTNTSNLIKKGYNYDLKTNKTDLEAAKSELTTFVNELDSATSEADIKAFYEKWFDIDFFIKTYAVNILVGMDDDYWANGNNYYLYFGKDQEKNTKVWFIPFDYDNTLGASIKKASPHGGVADGILQNPLEWGRNNSEKAPLISKLLSVKEYKDKFIKTLREVSAENSHWNTAKLKAQFLKWKNMVEPYLDSKDLRNNWISVTSVDYSCWNPSGYSLVSDPNIYDITRESILRWTNEAITSITFDLNGGKIGNDDSNKVVNLDNTNRTKSLAELVGKNPKKEGYIFMGWTATKDKDDYKEYVTTETVYARWKALSDIKELFIYEKENDASDGITVGICNVPNNTYIRELYINGKQAGQTEAANPPNPNDYTGGVNDEGYKGSINWYNGKVALVQGDKWVYPYTEAGKTYEIQIVYKDKSWGEIAKTNTINIKAEGGKGEFKATTAPAWKVEDNKFKFTTKPVLNFGNETINCPASTPTDWKNNWDRYYVLNIQKKSDWGSVTWNKLDPSLPDIDLLTAKNHEDNIIIPEYARNIDLMFRFYYVVKADDGYDEYWLVMFDCDQSKTFKVTTTP